MYFRSPHVEMVNLEVFGDARVSHRRRGESEHTF